MNTLEEELGLEWIGGPNELKELLQRSDYVILCLPVTKETINMMNQLVKFFMDEAGGILDQCLKMWACAP